MNDFGQAEREAEQVRQQEKEEMESRKREDEAKAKTRGELAAQKLQAEKNEQSLKKAVPVQQKKFAREVENLRSTFVSSLRSKKTPFKKKRSKKKVVTDINISSVIQESSSGTSVESDKKIQENAGGLDSRSCSVVDGSEPNSPFNMNEMPESVLKEKSCASLKQSK